MELLILLAMIGGVAYYIAKVSSESESTGIHVSEPGQSASPPAPPGEGLEFKCYETVTVDDPHHLDMTIKSQIVRWQIRPDKYVIGMPQIAADGLTAHIPIYRKT